MSSHPVMMPSWMGYFSCRMPRFCCASLPTYASFSSKPTIMPGCLGRPTIVANTERGASSPAKPAFIMPDPLSTTKLWTSSSAIVTTAAKCRQPLVENAFFVPPKQPAAQQTDLRRDAVDSAQRCSGVLVG